MASVATTQQTPIVATSESRAQTVKNWQGKHKVEIGAIALGTAAIIGAVVAGVLTGGAAFAALGLAGLAIGGCALIKGVVSHQREKTAEEQAATTIQRVFRGHIARTEVREIKKDLAEVDAAIISDKQKLADQKNAETAQAAAEAAAKAAASSKRAKIGIATSIGLSVATAATAAWVILGRGTAPVEVELDPYNYCPLANATACPMQFKL